VVRDNGENTYRASYKVFLVLKYTCRLYVKQLDRANGKKIPAGSL
jgi:hypothetical protein